ncbi:MAG: OmpA family protein [bacterium]|nr:OmpA family protein [bacterium]
MLGLWILLVGTAVVWGLQNEENDIEDRVSGALADAGIPIQEIEVDGRDVALGGAATALQRSEAEAVVREITGIRSIEWNDLPDVVIITDTTQGPDDSSAPDTNVPSSSVAPGTSTAPTVAPGLAHINATLDQGILKLSGAVPDAEAAARIAAVADLIYAPFLEGSVEVDTSLENASWVPNAFRVISVLPVLSNSGIQVAGQEAVITGSAPSDLRKAQLEGALGQALGESVRVTSEVAVSNLGPPSFAAEAPGDGTVVLSGVLPSDGVAQRIIGAAGSVYGEGNVISTVEVRDSIAETFSLYRVPLVFVQFAPVPQWEFNIEDDLITGALRGGATFEYGSSGLSDQLVVLLNTAAGILLRNPTLVGTVEGHTDDVGSDAFNQGLSEDRAQAAVDYLVAAGVDPARVVAIGYGETRPIGDNSTEEGRTINRRIEFFLGPAPQGGE